MTRTCGTQIRNLVLYPPELRGHSCFFIIKAQKVNNFESDGRNFSGEDPVPRDCIVLGMSRCLPGKFPENKIIH